MKLPEFNKLLVKNAVYLPVSELDENIRLSLQDSDIQEIQVDGHKIPCVSEDRYNQIVWNKDKGDKSKIEITKVESLSTRMNDSLSLFPLKSMFLSRFMSKEMAEDKLLTETKQEFEKNIRLLSDVKHSTEHQEKYLKLVKQWTEMRSMLVEQSHGDLDVKFLTEISENGSVGFIPFLAGRGVFYKIYIDDWDEDVIREVHINDGKLYIPPIYDENEEIHEILETHDFRKESAGEGLLWCVQNTPLSNDFSDEVSARGAIDFSIDINLLIKLLNPNSCLNYYVFDGLLEDYDAKTISSGEHLDYQ